MKKTTSTRSTVRFLALALAALCAPATALFAGEGLDQYRQLTLGSQGVAVAAKTATIGRMQLEFTEGTLFPLVDRDGDTVGLVFSGQGKYTLTVTDPQDRLVFQDNARHWSNQLVTSPDNVRDAFKSLTLLFAKPVLEELWKDVPPSVALPSSVQSDFEKTMKQIGRTELGFDHLAIEARLNGGKHQYVYGEFDGGVLDVGYVFDSVRATRERLFAFYSPPGYDLRYQRGISSQWIDEEGLGMLGFSLDNLNAAIETKDNKSGTIDTKLSLTTKEDGIRVLTFYLINNRDPKAERWDSPRNALTVKRITDGSGRELPFSHRYHELIVDTGAPQPAGTKLELEVETEGEIFTGPDGNRFDNYIDLYSVDWYPTPIYPAGRRFTFQVRIVTKKPFRPVTSGDTVSLTEAGDLYVLEAKSDTPIWMPAIFAGKYKTKEAKAGDVTIRAHAYGVSKESDIQDIANLAATFLQLYEKMLGPYPNKELEIVEIPTFAFFGISPSGVVILTSRTFKPDNDLMRKYLGNHGVNHMIAHELAHQWFGHKAWPQDPVEDNWLTESIAEYVSGLAMGIAVQATNANTAKILDFKQMLSEWRGYAKFAEGHGTIAAANLLRGEMAGDYRFYLLYCRGPMVLHMIRALIGEQRFIAILRGFLDQANYGPASTDELVTIASRVIGEDVSWYFDQWLQEDGIPGIKIKYTSKAGTLAGTVEQSADKPFKKIHIPILVEYEGGRREVKLVFQQQLKQEFSFPLIGIPDRVVVDPAHNNLADYE